MRTLPAIVPAPHVVVSIFVFASASAVSALVLFVASRSVLRTPVLIITMVAMTMVVFSSFMLSLRRSRFSSSGGLEKHPSLRRIIHHCFVGCLFLLFDGKHRVLSHFSRRISCSVGILQRHERVLLCRLFQLLIIGALDQSVYSTFSKQVALHFFRCAWLPIRSLSIIHPVDTRQSLCATACLGKFLNLLNMALFLSLLHHLVCFLALLERFSFLFPYSLLVRE